MDPEKAHQTVQENQREFLMRLLKRAVKYEVLGTDEVIAYFQRMAILKLSMKTAEQVFANTAQQKNRLAVPSCHG